MVKQNKFGNQLRTQIRKNNVKKQMRSAEEFIQNHLTFEKIFQALNEDSIGHLYHDIEEHIKQNTADTKLKKMLYHYFRRQIMRFNEHYDLLLPLPGKQFIQISRPPLSYNHRWLMNEKYIHNVHQRLKRYWCTTSNFSNDEVIGNILLSSILHGGISHLRTIESFFEQLKNGLKIHSIPHLNLPIIFLEPLSPHYGDIYDPKHSLRKSRNFIPDRMTQVWLGRYLSDRFFIKGSINDYLTKIFKKLGIPLQLNQLLNSAPCLWPQLDNVDLDNALTQSLAEHILTCGLSLQSFKNYFSPDLQSNGIPHPILSLESSIKSKISLTTIHLNHQNQLQDFHKQLLRSIKINKQNIDSLIVYLDEHRADLAEPAVRINLWLISLFSPTEAQINHLCDLFDLSASAWLGYQQYQSKLATSSIYTYYSKIGETWLFYSSQYAEEEDLNARLEQIYQQMLSQGKKSDGQKLDLLKRFHLFQVKLFQADVFPDSLNIDKASHPRAQIISHQTFNAALDVIDGLTQRQNYHPHDSNMLKLIYILAYRTGMRLNEIIGLRIKDIEGESVSSIWIRPYRHKNESHQLKTDSAERNLPIDILLSEEEHQLLQTYCLDRRLSHETSDYLFSFFNRQHRLNDHFISGLFKQLLDQCLTQHQYSFHSLRHTAINQLALILQIPIDCSSQITGYDTQHCHKIRNYFIKTKAQQNLWFHLSHVMGHIDPTETFKSYFHVGYLIAGYKIAQYDIALPSITLLNINPELKIELHKQNISLKSIGDQILAQLNIQQLYSLLKPVKQPKLSNDTKQFNLAICGTAKSNYSYLMVQKILKKLDLGTDTTSLAHQYHLPTALVETWQNRMINLKRTTTRKKSSRFILEPKRSDRILPHIETTEEKGVLEYFFKQLNNHQLNDSHLALASHIFSQKSNVSHPGLNFPIQDFYLASEFIHIIYPLFPNKLWHIAMSDHLNLNSLQSVIHTHKIPYSINTQLKNAIRIELRSQNTKKSLAVFKYCMILLMILIQPSDTQYKPKPSSKRLKKSRERVS